MSLLSKPKPRRKPDFSLMMANIVFLLLLFYLATGSLIKKNELETDIPVTEDLPLERLPRPLLLVTERGLSLDGVAVSPGEAAANAKRALADQHGAGFLNVLAERHLPAAKFLDIMADIQAAGVPVRVVTLHQRPQDSAGRP